MKVTITFFYLMTQTSLMEWDAQNPINLKCQDEINYLFPFPQNNRCWWLNEGSEKKGETNSFNK